MHAFRERIGGQYRSAFSQIKIWIFFMSSDDSSNFLFIIKAYSFQFWFQNAYKYHFCVVWWQYKWDISKTILQTGNYIPSIWKLFWYLFRKLRAVKMWLVFTSVILFGFPCTIVSESNKIHTLPYPFEIS